MTPQCPQAIYTGQWLCAARSLPCRHFINHVEQEAYIGRLNKEYIELLRGDGSEADKFWKLCKRIREDRRCAGVQISMRGSDPLPIICRMINEGVITLGDLDEFSEELREVVATITEPHKDI